ncbi:hypothetical protein [Lactobacillus kunkeei] [Lactiplantibacillus mudanjiangensis]|nr:hypothetical protein [Lactobacillus kunkeei] [Lactiplantibacillus mudanjiangensis]
MKFKLRKLIRKFGQPIRIYDGSRVTDGTTNAMGEFIPTKSDGKPYVEDTEPIIPTSGANIFADNLNALAGGLVENYSAVWYSKHDVEEGTVVSVVRADGTEKKFEVSKKSDYGPIADIKFYYLQESDQHAANI